MTGRDHDAPLCLPRRPLTRPLAVALPEGTVDSHFHVFRADAPLVSPRSYTPQIATLAEWQTYAAATGIARGVLVQPSVYGTDNSVLLEALAADPDRLRGIVVIDPATSPAEIARLDRLGVRGVRINTRNLGGLPLDAARTLAGRIAPFGWSLQLQIQPAQLPAITTLLAGIDLAVVIDHLGFVPLGTEEAPAHLQALVRLMDTMSAYVKLSAPYRLMTWPDVTGLRQAVDLLASAHPDRILWGSDWPHTELWQAMPDDTDLIETAQTVLTFPALARAAFSNNADRLFFAR